MKIKNEKIFNELSDKLKINIIKYLIIQKICI